MVAMKVGMCVRVCICVFECTPHPQLHQLHQHQRTNLNPPHQVKFAEAVDQMVGQIIAHLAAAEERSGSAAAADGGTGPGSGAAAAASQQRQRPRFSICVTADHSTPVIFGDHSHEPVPFAVAHVRHAVRALGGARQLALRAPGARISNPDVKAPPPLDDLLRQAAWVEARREAAAAGRPFPGETGEDGGGGYGPWPEAWPQVVMGDRVAAFDELSAGGLGRFSGAQAMPLLKQFVGVDALAASE
jgi:hypothetical protein